MDIINHCYENIDLGKINAFSLEGVLKKYSTEKLHIHESHQILGFKSGMSLLLDESKKQPLYNNMTAFIPAGCPHRSIVLGKEVVYKSLYISRELFDSSNSHIRVFDISELGKALFYKINLSNNVSLDTEEDLTSECLQLFLKILKQDMKKRSSIARLPVASKPQNQAVIQYIENHYAEKIRLKDFSDLIHCTERHISRIFKEELKISIFEYLKIFRVMKASFKLDITNKTITETAYECGYESISCFYKDFGQIFSITPRQFKKRIAGGLTSFWE